MKSINDRKSDRAPTPNKLGKGQEEEVYIHKDRAMSYRSGHRAEIHSLLFDTILHTVHYIYFHQMVHTCSRWFQSMFIILINISVSQAMVDKLI
jgi:hypothetical protein